MTSAKENGNKYADYLNLPPLSWTRPNGPPRVWRVVEGRRKTTDGETLRFFIQEVPKDLEDDVVEFMAKYFLVEEPICVDTGVIHDPLAVREFRTFWKQVIAQGVSIVALTANSDPDAKPQIAAVNVLNIKVPGKEVESEGTNQFRSGSVKKILGVVDKLCKESDAVKKYGVDRYLSAYGLSVHPSLRGQGLGQEMLAARDDIGPAYQIPVSETVFTATASQILAARCGHEVLLERRYSEILDDEGKLAFPSVTVKSMKVMGKRLY